MKVPRPRGAQPGNQNARKHGYYSSALTGQEKIDFNHAAEIEGLDDEISLIRARLKSVVQRDPDNLRLVDEATSTLARLMRTNHKLGFANQDKFAQARWDVLYENCIKLGFSASQIAELYLGKWPLPYPPVIVEPANPPRVVQPLDPPNVVAPIESSNVVEPIKPANVVPPLGPAIVVQPGDPSNLVKPHLPPDP